MNKNIPLYLIESFLTAAKARSFDTAGATLGITQSTLSKQMLLLEELLPRRVFTFDGRKKVLTKYGELLYQNLSAKFLDTQEIIRQSDLHFSDPVNLTLKISGRGELLDIIAKTLNHPSSFHYFPMDGHAATDALIHRRTDIAITGSPAESSEIVSKLLWTHHFQIIIPRSLQRTAPKEDGEIIKLITTTPALIYKEQNEELISLARAYKINLDDIKAHRIFPNFATLADMANRGLGWAILPTHIEFDKSKTHVVPISNDILKSRKFYFCYRREFVGMEWTKTIFESIRTK